jgi:hypothetical protein
LEVIRISQIGKTEFEFGEIRRVTVAAEVSFLIDDDDVDEDVFVLEELTSILAIESGRDNPDKSRLDLDNPFNSKLLQEKLLVSILSPLL